MRYLRVTWKHSFPDEPVLTYSEVDENDWEVRVVEVFPDGRKGFASPAESTGSTRLGEDPIPSVDEISAIPEFEAVEISRNDFEDVWANRKNL